MAKRLDSPQGIKALERAIGPTRMAKYSKMDLVSAHLESWSHPWLAQWAVKAGYRDSGQGLAMDDATGYFDHAPYAIESVCGVAVPTPFESRDGKVFFVKEHPWVKAVTIVGQVETALCAMHDDLAGRTRAAWDFAFRRASMTIRHGLALLDDPSTSHTPEERAEAIQHALGALQALGGDLGEEILAWGRWSAEGLEQAKAQIARLAPIAQVLAPCEQPAA